MSCTPLPGYDAWKTREPEMDDEACEQCGTALQRERIGGRTYWFCERCDEKVLARTVTQGEVAAQVADIYQSFNADPAQRTCASCGYVFPTTPLAERLGFLGRT